MVQREGRAIGISGVLPSVDPNRCGVSSAHQALLYGSEEAFLAGTVPFIRDGLECSEPVQIATTDRNAAWLRAALGADARHVAFCDDSQWYGHPVRALAALHSTVQAASRDGHRLRMIGERLWTACTAQEKRAWARHESLVNAVLALGDAALVCTYDTGVVDPDVVANVARTHPGLVVNGESRPSPDYIDPVVFNAEFNRSPLPELLPPALWLRFRQLDQLAVLRAFVTSHATEAGAAAQSVGQFVQAVDEVATNAVEHGGGSAVLQIWTGPHTIVCEVSDTGAGLLDPLAGHLPPDSFTAHGHGLWLARQFSDLLELHSDSAGTIVRLHLTLH
ncbi:MAG: anti-sigma factor RsbA family regulatory protein [Pseudonocardiaceae bacterium]